MYSNFDCSLSLSSSVSRWSEYWVYRRIMDNKSACQQSKYCQYISFFVRFAFEAMSSANVTTALHSNSICYSLHHVYQWYSSTLNVFIFGWKFNCMRYGTVSAAVASIVFWINIFRSGQSAEPKQCILHTAHWHGSTTFCHWYRHNGKQNRCDTVFDHKPNYQHTKRIRLQRSGCADWPPHCTENELNTKLPYDRCS